MKGSQKQTILRVGVITAGLVVFIGIVAFVLNQPSKDKAALEKFEQLTRELRADVEARDRTIDQLQNSLRQIHASNTSAPQTSPANKVALDLSGNSELVGRLEAITAAQKQTMALVHKVGAKVGAFDSPERTAQEAQAGIAALEEAQAEHQKKLAEATQRMTELVVSLKVPDEAAGLDTDKALNTPSLQAYWPYFEARRERENARVITERLNLRIIQEQIDAGIRTKKGTSQ